MASNKRLALVAGLVLAVLGFAASAAASVALLAGMGAVMAGSAQPPGWWGYVAIAPIVGVLLLLAVYLTGRYDLQALRQQATILSPRNLWNSRWEILARAAPGWVRWLTLALLAYWVILSSLVCVNVGSRSWVLNLLAAILALAMWIYLFTGAMYYSRLREQPPETPAGPTV